MSLMIRDVPVFERPRERLLLVGVQNLSNIELLSVIIKTGTKNESVSVLASKILNSVPDISSLKNVNLNSLKKINGIGKVKAMELLAAIELGKRIFLSNNVSGSKKYNNSKAIYQDNKYLFVGKKQEYFYCLYLNSQKELIERKLLFMGTLNKSIVHPREIFKEAYLLSASSIVCMHNHPSNDVTPSKDDIILTKSLMEIGRLQQIPVIDHIIFGDDCYYSFYEEEVKNR